MYFKMTSLIEKSTFCALVCMHAFIQVAICVSSCVIGWTYLSIIRCHHLFWFFPGRQHFALLIILLLLIELFFTNQCFPVTYTTALLLAGPSMSLEKSNPRKLWKLQFHPCLIMLLIPLEQHLCLLRIQFLKGGES